MSPSPTSGAPHADDTDTALGPLGESDDHGPAGDRDAPDFDPTGGRLILVGTPIGNLGDAGPRMRQAIETADVIAAEDTRRFLSLAQRLGLSHTKRVISVFDHNEAGRAPEIVDLIRDGRTVVLLSDAGMPAVSDPGYRVVRACAEAGDADHRDTRAVRGAHGACGLGPAERSLQLRGFHPAQIGGAHCSVRGARE